jgi:hypothetical protein
MSKEETEMYARRARRETSRARRHQTYLARLQLDYRNPAANSTLDAAQCGMLDGLIEGRMRRIPGYEMSERLMRVMEEELGVGGTTVSNIVGAIGRGVGVEVVRELRDGWDEVGYAALFPDEVLVAIRDCDLGEDGV